MNGALGNSLNYRVSVNIDHRVDQITANNIGSGARSSVTAFHWAETLLGKRVRSTCMNQ